MASTSTRRRRRGGSHDNEERWLLTYADMITLLMALFMLLFSISSVNISKYEVLQKSLKAAFSGAILTGGQSILQSGSISTKNHSPANAEIAIDDQNWPQDGTSSTLGCICIPKRRAPIPARGRSGSSRDLS